MKLFENDIVELLNVTPRKGEHADDGWVVGNRFIVKQHFSVGEINEFVSVKGFQIYLHVGQWRLYKRPIRNWIKSLFKRNQT